MASFSRRSGWSSPSSGGSSTATTMHVSRTLQGLSGRQEAQAQCALRTRAIRREGGGAQAVQPSSHTVSTYMPKCNRLGSFLLLGSLSEIKDVNQSHASRTRMCTAPGRCPWSVRQPGSVPAATPLVSHLYTRPVHRGGPPRPAVDALRATTSWGLNLCAGSCGGGVVPQPLLGTRLSSVRPSRPPSASDTRRFSRVRPRACSHMQ